MRIKKIAAGILLSLAVFATGAAAITMTACVNDDNKAADGKSAYDIWLLAGNQGTEEDFLEWLKGEDGAQGEAGKSAYQIWLEAGHQGTEEDFLEWLKCEGTSEGTDGLEFYPLDDGTYAVGAGKAKYLSEISIPATYRGKTVSGIVSDGFNACTSLKRLTFSQSTKLITISDGAFSGCALLESISIPDSVTAIGANAFNGCASLKDITINQSSSLSTIGEKAFAECTTLEEITIPPKVKLIGEDAFYGCMRLNRTYIYDIVAWCNITFSDSDSNPLRGTGGLGEGGELYLDGELVTQLIIPEDVYSVPANAFFSCNSITSVKISDSVAYIGEAAFANCTNITSVEMSANTAIIGLMAFASCLNLSDITIPDRVVTIGDYAFYQDKSLTEIYIPESVVNMGWHVFSKFGTFTIYCQAESKPDGWDDSWYGSDYSSTTVVWGYDSAG